MKHSLLLLIATLMCVGCASSKKAGTKEFHKRDSIRTEVRKEIVFVPDTVYLAIPEQAAERTTRDSTSHLENDYATSDARVYLFHVHQTLPSNQQKRLQERP